mmetsp:Transcript_3017/g.5934  ORF Transcript_3017/g.5934 Transcript_3017/m.5934 type:complete len:219 (+) Transcript_3017:309-965(+)
MTLAQVLCCTDHFNSVLEHTPSTAVLSSPTNTIDCNNVQMSGSCISFSENIDILLESLRELCSRASEMESRMSFLDSNAASRVNLRRAFAVFRWLIDFLFSFMVRMCSSHSTCLAESAALQSSYSFCASSFSRRACSAALSAASRSLNNSSFASLSRSALLTASSSFLFKLASRSIDSLVIRSTRSFGVGFEVPNHPSISLPVLGDRDPTALTFAAVP